MKIDIGIEEILEAKEVLNNINKQNLSNIIFYENNKIINISPQVLDNFKFTGLNNTDFITSGFYKINELDSLFIRAPIIVNYNNIYRPAIYNRTMTNGQYDIYIEGHLDNDLVSEIRLPTIKEAPRNTWLAPWLELPDSLIELNLLLWAKNGSIRQIYKGRCKLNDIAWKNVIKLQIIED